MIRDDLSNKGICGLIDLPSPGVNDRLARVTSLDTWSPSISGFYSFPCWFHSQL